MGALTAFGRTAVINTFFRPASAGTMTTAYLALTTAAPVSTDTGDTIIEPVAASYQRVGYPLGAAYWTLSGPGQVINAQAVTWSTPTDDWGEVIGWALCTTSTSGMVLAFGRLRRSSTIQAGMRLKVPAGSMRISLT